MNPLLNFTPRMVAVVILVLLCTNLFANNSTPAVSAQKQSAGEIVLEFVILLGFMLFPLFIKRRGSYKRATK